MRLNRIISASLVLILTFLTITGSTACRREPEPEPVPTPRPATPPPSTPEPTPEPLTYAPYNGIVEFMFFHEVLAWPELAYNSIRRENLDAEYVTAWEFRRVLEELYANNYVLVNINDVYTEYMAETGYYAMRQNTLELPAGTKPLVMFFDNMNFREDLIQYGFMTRYVLGSDGEIWAEGTDPDGNKVTSQDNAAITILDKFVKENPAFSHNGAKGCLALTGAQGILGYRTQKPEEETNETRLFRMQEVALVTPIVEKLRDTGWYFGSHTYSRSSLGNMTLENVQLDAERWLDEVGSIVGETKILTYPASSRLDGADQNAPGPALQYYVSIGFRFFASYGSNHFVKIKSDDHNIPAVIMDRAFICGTTFRNHRHILARFFDVKDVFDPMRPEEFGTNWGD